MSEENKAFQNALSRLTYDFALRGAIRHLYDLGYRGDEIRVRLDFPATLSSIDAEILCYEQEREAAAAGSPRYEYVKETDAYGKVSFRRRIVTS